MLWRRFRAGFWRSPSLTVPADPGTIRAVDPDGRGPTDQWQSARARVDGIVTREDPEGLLAMGAPEDEYRPEVVRPGERAVAVGSWRGSP